MIENKGSGIGSFLGIKTGSTRVERYERTAGNVSKEERRKLESELLRPDKIPEYIGKKSDNRGINDYVISMVFREEEDRRIVSKHFKISKVMGGAQSIIDTRMFIDLLKEIEEGRLVYDGKKRKFHYPGTSRRRC